MRARVCVCGGGGGGGGKKNKKKKKKTKKIDHSITTTNLEGSI
jgi:hypothetical protein